MSSRNTILWTDFLLNITQEQIGQNFIKPFFGLETIPSKGRLSDLIAGKNTGKSYKILELLGRTTRDIESGKRYTVQDYPFLKKGEKIWNSYLTEFPYEKDRLSDIVADLCVKKYNIRISDKGEEAVFDLSDKLEEIKNGGKNSKDTTHDLAYQLSVLSILATTWPYWEALRTNDYHGKDEHKVKNLLLSVGEMIFPISAIPSSREQSLENPADVKDKYNRAVSLFKEKGDYAASAALFSEIVTEHLTAPNEILATSYEYLYKCYGISSVRISPIGTKEELRRWASHYGSTDIPPRAHQIRQKPQPSSSDDIGLCVFNKLDSSKTTSQIFRWITETLPARWKWKTASGSDLSETKFTGFKVRFVFINSSYSQNLEDALLILDAVRNHQIAGGDPLMYQNMEMVIRCQEEEATSLLDTACSFLDRDYPPVKIFLIDEKKRAADYLFAQHPLFYPLTFSFNRCKKDTTGTTLIVVSDNPDTEYVSWLIRDAFWMLPQSSAKIRSKIITLSPNAAEIAAKIAAVCPGLSAFMSIADPISDYREPLSAPVNIDIDDISFPELEYHPVSVNSRAFQAKLENIVRDDVLPYFVVDSDSDLSAVTLGKRIREILIKKAVSKHQLGKYSSDSTVIAVRIQNPDYAGLTRDLIVPKETEHDGFWFNDYKLITFGSFKDLFSWDQLTGGAIEFTAQCIHLQYCSSNDQYDFTKEPSTEDMTSYFHRLYNRDSSFAAAMSLPYRLFEADISPDRWYISNDNAYWGEAERALLAQTFDARLREDEAKERPELIERLARYEHTRWCCYMLSMGWLPATQSETVSYINNGVTRHSLQIAKLHPCICSWKDLEYLYRDLHMCYSGAVDAYGKPRINKLFKAYRHDDPEHFQKIDINNIRQTADILRAKPFPERQRIQDSERAD